MILTLAIKSLRNRKFTAALTVLSIALAVVLLLGVERIRHEARESFASTISGTDLIVGARSSPVHLLLYSVFRIGNATNNIRWDSYRAHCRRGRKSHGRFPSRSAIRTADSACSAPRRTISSISASRAIAGSSWRRASASRDAHDAVLGADVAESLGYRLGQIDRHRARRRRRQLLAARGASVPGGRRARAHRHARGPHDARHAGRAWTRFTLSSNAAAADDPLAAAMRAKARRRTAQDADHERGRPKRTRTSDRSARSPRS